MLNLILDGSQYIYQNLIKNHLVSSSHLKGTYFPDSPISIPSTALGQQQEQQSQRHLRGQLTGLATTQGHQLLQTRSNDKRCLTERGEQEKKTLGHVRGRLPSLVPSALNWLSTLQQRLILALVIYSAFHPL